jgi:putative ABC transport system permease protein
MFKNLLTIAIRNILKEKSYSAINIFGLTIGITCSMFLLMYMLDELSFDRYHKNADNVYRIISNIKEPDNAFTWAVAQVPLADELRDNYPEVSNAVRFFQINRSLYKNGEQQFYEDDFFLADSTAFDMFTYEFIGGDPATALDAPFSLVLTESAAKKYFGEAPALGQSIQNEQGEEFKITAVMKDVPLNSHFRFQGLVSRSTRPNYPSNWGGFGVFTYIQLPANYDLKKMYVSLDTIVKQRVNPIFDRFGIKVAYELQKITDIHLHSKIQDEAEEGGDITVIYVFGLVAAFMIIIACINYMNLATARSANRAKEVGVRKVMGSQRKQLILQFLTESVLITLISLVLSLVMIYALLPVFNNFANKELSFNYVINPTVIFSLLGIVLLAGVVGGSYPAFYLSSFNPIQVLKGKLAARGGSAVFRKVLVVIQFGISIFMLISTLIVYDQLKFLRTKDLGFKKEQVIRFDLSGPVLGNRSALLAERMIQNPVVLHASTTGSTPGQGIGKNVFQVEDNEGKMTERGVDVFAAGYDFVQTLDMQIVAGRDFSRDISSDTIYGALVNESMVKRMGWDNPIGKKFTVPQTGPNPPTFEKRVVGVVKDYHQNSLYDPIEPLMIILNTRNNFLIVKTKAGDIKQTLASLEKTWKEVNPNNPFEVEFLDADFNSQYQADEKRSQIFTVFSGLTIFIACLGLLGLSAFTTQQRYKEIGVRKVIGASIQSLIILVSREFFILVGIGTVLAFPVAWYVTNGWLQNFAYRIELKGEWLTFILSAAIAFLITLVTVGYHVLRAASANPVNALRDE